MKLFVSVTYERQVVLQFIDDSDKILCSCNFDAAAAAEIAEKIEACAAMANGGTPPPNPQVN